MRIFAPHIWKIGLSKPNASNPIIDNLFASLCLFVRRKKFVHCRKQFAHYRD